MLSEYRKRFSDYHSQLNLEEYLFRTGSKSQNDKSHISGENTDLLSRQSIDGLRTAFEETAEFLETERNGIRKLLAFAYEGARVLSAREITGEIEDYESAATVQWEDRRVGVRELEELIYKEDKLERRRELYTRQIDLIDEVQDLRAERQRVMAESVKVLGFDNYRAMKKDLQGVDISDAARYARLILDQTEKAYIAKFPGLLAGVTGLSLDDALPADLEYLKGVRKFDSHLPADRILGVLDETCRGLGFRINNQSNFSLDAKPPRGKQRKSFYSTIRVPQDIRASISLIGGQANYRQVLSIMGQSQQFAWTSANLKPENRFAACGMDCSTPAGWGFLFQNLLGDRQWLESCFGVIDSQQLRHALGIFRLLELRRQAALTIYEAEFHAGEAGVNPAIRYSELMTDALKIHAGESGHLIDLSDSCDAANFIRAAGFEAQFRDHLKTRYGSRWWDSARAGEEIIDIWNTGLRYDVGELSSKLGLGAINFDYLVEDVLNGL